MTTANDTTMTVEQAAVLAMLTTENVSRVYSGKPGCGCGCKGTYSERKAMKTRVMNTVKARSAEARFTDCLGGEVCFSVDDRESRYSWVFMTKEAYAELAAKAAVAA